MATFTVRDLQDALGLTYGRRNKFVEQLIVIGVLGSLSPFDTDNRRFCAPSVLDVLLGSWDFRRLRRRIGGGQ